MKDGEVHEIWTSCGNDVLSRREDSLVTLTVDLNMGGRVGRHSEGWNMNVSSTGLHLHVAAHGLKESEREREMN
jgi:hypothetical protein